MPVAPGTQFGPYQITAGLGAGGMGEVYRARDPRLERDVAIKVIRAGLLAEPEVRRRFRGEATALSRVNHPNVASVYDVGEQGDMDFLVMELIPGESLAERLRSGPLPATHLLPLALQLAEGMAAAHEAGIIHRDLKPANVRVTPEGRLKIVDFGLARELETPGGSELAATITSAGTTAGTLAYMAPELLGGGRADARSDVFALGIVLYEMATGRHPYPTESVIALVNAIANRPPAAPRTIRDDLPEGFDGVVLSAMRAEPSRRPATAGEVLAELRGLAASDTARPKARPPRRSKRGRVRSLAVLPLENLSGDAGQDFFADGITEALIADLAKIEGLRVISRTSAMRYKNARLPLPQIAAELSVDAVVEGTVIRAGDRVRITAQLIHAASDTLLWAESFDRDQSDILTLQSDAARAIAGEIRVKLTPRTRERLAVARRVNPAAYETYLRGRHLMNRRTEESLLRAMDHFRAAIDLDPTYPLAHVGLGDVHNLLGYHSLRAPGESFPRAKAAALRALEIDPDAGEAHTSLAYALHYHDWDWTAAEQEYRRGLDLSPSYPQASLWYLNLLASRGRFDEALEQSARTVVLDPLAAIGAMSESWILYFMRDYDRAIAVYERAIAIDPGFAAGYLWGSWSCILAGRHEQAVTMIKTALSLARQSPMMSLTLAYAHAYAGDQTRAREILDEMLALQEQRHIPAYLVAIAYDALGESARAWDWMERALAERSHWLVFLDVDARFDGFRGDPRYAGLRKAIGL